MPTIHLLIKGKVQGVFYRASAKEVADKLHLRGWIRNTVHGHVEAIVNGPVEKLKKFIEWCWQGPERADVKEVIETPREETEYNSFTVQRGKLF